MKRGYIYFTADTRWIFIPEDNGRGLVSDHRSKFWSAGNIEGFTYDYRISIETLQTALSALLEIGYAEKT